MKISPFFVVLLSVASVKSATFPECDIIQNGEILPRNIIFPIQDNEQIGLLLELTTDKVDEFSLKDEGDTKYFDLKPFDPADVKIEISLTPDYKLVEQELASTSAETKLTITLNIMCGAINNAFYIDFPITDNNNQETELSSLNIEYKIPLPFPLQIPLHLLVGNDKITARDADISNSIINFELDPPDIFKILEEKDPTDPLDKTYVAVIMPIKPLSNYQKTTFKITAKDKDSRNPATADLIIDVDTDSSIPQSPHFTENYYTGDYEIDEETSIHTFNLEDLKIDNVAATQTILPKIEAGDIDFTEYLSVEYVPASTAIKFNLKKDLTPEILEEHNYLILSLSASIQDFDIRPTTVSVLITLPAKELNGNEAFTKSVYKADYIDDQIQLSEDIIVTVQNVVITSEGQYAKNFAAKPNAANPLRIDVTVEIPLEPSVIEENDYILLPLSAKVDDDEYGSTLIIINLPAEECPTTPPSDVFTKTLYKGNYLAPNTGDHSIDLETIDLNANELRVIIEPHDYPNIFEINDENLADIKIEISAELDDEFLKDNEIVSLILVAKDTSGVVFGSAVVILDLPPGKCDVNPILNVFGDVLYEGKYEEHEGGDPTVTFDKTITATSTEALNVLIIDGSDHFQINFDNPPNVVITVSKPISEETIRENKFITLVLSADGQESGNDYGKTALAIELPTNKVFGQKLYNGVYVQSETGFDTVVFDTTITTSSSDAIVIQFDPNDEFASNFKIDYTTEAPKVLITVETPLEGEALEKDFITLILIAKNTDETIVYGNTVLVIDLAEVCLIEPTDDIFVKTIFDGTYEVSAAGEHTVSTEKIEVILDGTSISLAGEHARNFEVEVTSDKEVKLTIKEPLNENVWNTNGYLSILMQATSGQQTGAARIVLDLPNSECENPEGITFTDTSFSILPSVGIIIGTLKAEFVPTEDHTFAISHEPSWVVLNDNELSVVANGQPEPGTFTLKATVTGDDSKKSANAVVTIYVKSNDGGRTKYSMKVLDIDEETEIKDILNLEDDVYKYIIQRQVPHTDPFLFDIEEINSEHFLTTKGIDREDPLLADLQIPQIVLTLSLQEKTPSTNKRSSPAIHPLFKYIPTYQNRNSQELKTCLMLDGTILREDHIMHVPIIIKDKNDESPKFVPTSIVVGYPTKDIVFDINPQYLMKVEATDDDEGENARITYSSTSTSVKVNPTTGIVYPTEALYNSAQPETITITASDGLNEAEPPFTAKILLLDKNHMSILVFTNVLLEDLETTLEALSNEINVQLRHLSAGSLPVQKSGVTRADSDVYLKAIIYGIDNDAAVTHTSLKEKLAGKPVSVIQYIPGTGGIGGDTDPEECDDTGLIAGVSVLAVALVICICGFIAFYIKNKKSNGSLDLEQLTEPKTSFKKSNASQNEYNSGVVLKDVTTRRPTQYPMEGPKLDEDKESNSSTSSNDEDEFDETRERRKSVTFNEKAEHFVITKENETEPAKADYANLTEI